MSAKTALQPVRESGWRQGYRNLLRKEISLWFGTHRWWKQLLIWMLVTNGILLLVGFGISQEGAPEGGSVIEMLVQVFFTLAAISLPIGAVLAVQDAIIGERQLGTAEWILSKPVSRRAFVLAKLAGHGLSFFTLGIAIPCAIAYPHIAAWAGTAVPVVPFLASVGLLTLNALAVLFGGSVLTGFLPWTLKVTPWKMVDFGVAWMIQGTLPPGLGQIVAITVGWMFLFVIVALFRFEREEL